MEKATPLIPRLSEKTHLLSADGVYVFDVPRAASKDAIARAVKSRFDVRVLSVNIANVKGKSKRTIRKGSRPVNGKRADSKKAYVRLKEGEKLPFFEAEEEKEKKQEKLQARADKAAQKAAKKTEKSDSAESEKEEK